MTRSPTRVVSLPVLAVTAIFCVQGCARWPESIDPLPVSTAEYEGIDCHDLVREETRVYNQLHIPIRRQNAYAASEVKDAVARVSNAGTFALGFIYPPLFLVSMYGLPGYIVSDVFLNSRSDYTPHTRRERVTNERKIGRLLGKESALMSVIEANDCEAVTGINYARPSDPARLQAPRGLFADTENRAYLVTDDVTGNMSSRSSDANLSIRAYLNH